MATNLITDLDLVNVDYRQFTMTADEYAAAQVEDSVYSLAHSLIEVGDERVLASYPTTDPVILLARNLIQH